MHWQQQDNSLLLVSDDELTYLSDEFARLGLRPVPVDDTEEYGYMERFKYRVQLEKGVIPFFSTRFVNALVFRSTRTQDIWERHRLLLDASHNTRRYYKLMKMRKRGGGTRKLYSACGILRAFHYCFFSLYKDLGVEHPSATAYRKGLSIKDNATPHAGRDVLIKLDIKDFFGSLTFGRVLHMLRTELSLPDAGAVLLARLLTLENALPQGVRQIYTRRQNT